MNELVKLDLIVGTVEELTEYIFDKYMKDCKYEQATLKHNKLYCTKEGIKEQLLYIKNSNDYSEYMAFSGIGKLKFGVVGYYFLQDKEMNELGIDAKYVCITPVSITRFFF